MTQTTEKFCPKQLLAADGWLAGYEQEDSTIITEPLVAWACGEITRGPDREDIKHEAWGVIVGWHGELESAQETGNFCGYFHPTHRPLPSGAKESIYPPLTPAQEPAA